MKVAAMILGVLTIGTLTGCSKERVSMEPDCRAAPATSSPLILRTTTRELTYVPGEALVFSTTAENPTDDPVRLTFPSSCQAEYSIDGDSPPESRCSPAVTEVTIPAHSSFEWTYRHRWEEYRLETGWHQVIGSVIGVGPSCPTRFRVIRTVLPSESFVLNFDSVESSGEPVLWAEEYWPYGVRFRSETDGTRGAKPTIETRNGNRYLTVGVTSYPPGFNIIADFEMRVPAATVEVSSAVGASITMIAKDAKGNTVDTATSDPVESIHGFLTLSVESKRGIASIEWWPSQQGAAVILDNLAIEL